MPWFGLAVFVGSTALSATLPAIDQHLPRDIAPNSATTITIPRDGGPCGAAANGVPQHNYDDCCNDLKGKTLTINAVDGTSGVKIDGLPYNCISVASFFTADNAGGPVPFACGDACLQYSGLNDDQYNHLRDIWVNKQ